MKRLITALASLTMVVASLAAAPPAPAQAATDPAPDAVAMAYPQLGQAPTWAACGFRDSPNKVVATFPGGLRLTCGNESFGYRHILAGHRRDFENKAAGTRLNWRDIAHWSIHYNMTDPDRIVRQNSYTTCRNRLLYLQQTSGGAYIPSNFRVAYNHNTMDVITAFPGSNC